MTRSSRTLRINLFGTAVLVVLVAAQTAVLNHVFLEGHPAGEPCTICLASSSLETANLAGSEPLIASGFAPKPSRSSSPLAISDDFLAQFARGPPLAS